MPGMPPGRAVRTGRVTAAVLTHAPFAPDAADRFPFAPAPGTDRLAWPAAVAAILVVCAVLWLGIGSLVRLILA